MDCHTKNILIIFQKGLDKLANVCYNGITIPRGTQKRIYNLIKEYTP